MSSFNMHVILLYHLIKLIYIYIYIYIYLADGENWHFSNANYSIKHNSKVPIEDILDIDMCLRIRNLKKIVNLLNNNCIRAISVKGVLNKKFQICSNILRSYMICCVYVCMYGYEMVCISMHEYLLAPSKV